MPEELIKDPVCGMRLQPADALHASQHEGTSYRFCSEACKQKFEREPARFLPRGPGGAA